MDKHEPLPVKFSPHINLALRENQVKEKVNLLVFFFHRDIPPNEILIFCVSSVLKEK